ncbi:hypothetical protein AVEN_269713-1 [Araneus ventricosus]|uniref:Uncharacterized protein n=1 Tax=Araneus ventricosus TaxID=182803 RepID=A0A4Y2KQE9_ARAVE|nr:hypothetical protein AVEN_269713-1 [Araneus ventricosus]
MSASASSRCKSLNNPDSFCYICGSFTIPSQRTNISTFVREAYFAYFNVKIGDQGIESSEVRSSLNDEDFEIEDDSDRKGFEQHEFNDFARDLGLSKKASELLASKLHEKNLLEKGSKVSYFRSGENAFLQYFRSDDGFVYCHNVYDLMEELRISAYNATEWRLFIDSSKWSLSVSSSTLEIYLVQSQ